MFTEMARKQIYNVFEVKNSKQDNVITTTSKREAYEWFDVLLQRNRKMYRAYAIAFERCKNVDTLQDLTQEHILICKHLFDTASYPNQTYIKACKGCIWVSFIDQTEGPVALCFTGVVDHPMQIMSEWLYQLKQYPDKVIPEEDV